MTVDDDVKERLARIETKLDRLLVVENTVDGRLGAVERKQWYHSGAIALAGFVLYKIGIPIKWV